MISALRKETAGVHNVDVHCIIGTAYTVRTTSRIQTLYNNMKISD
jgi:hypothetical protein